MIVTLDTGILVRGTSRSNGAARRLLQRLAEDPSQVLALSPFILAEVGKALSYPNLQEFLRITPHEVHEHVAYLRRVARLVVPQLGIPVVLNDPEDEPVIYTAIGAGADVLCTLDRDFYAANVLRFCERYHLEVMDDVTLLARLSEP